MAEWIGCFPDELQIGDVWGEYGELDYIAQNPNELTWKLHWGALTGRATHWEHHWPDRAPIRVLRP